MKEFDYRGLAALVIAAAASVGVFLLAPAVLILGVVHGEGASHVVVALGGALIGAVSVYMGMKEK